ncbi:MAG: 16S rRNA processing protein RimM [Fimbriimonadaceae bacterium]|nr:16S rRNA processing protein RimM [Fimbriimonadaceae bacterium]QYK54880.1 MAG: 16S rRNA processing protein RimM [Fimbriimonadaceae bacterium]
MKPDGPEPEIVAVGQIVGTHGVKGGLRVNVLTDFTERFEPGETLLLDGEPRKVLSLNWHKGQARMKLEGVDNMEAAEALKWKYLGVPEEDRPELDEDEFLARDLVGMTVVTTEGLEIGPLDEVMPFPAHDVLRIGEVMIPAVNEFVRDIDFDSRRITVHVIPGMLPEEPGKQEK